MVPKKNLTRWNSVPVTSVSSNFATPRRGPFPARTLTQEVKDLSATSNTLTVWQRRPTRSSDSFSCPHSKLKLTRRMFLIWKRELLKTNEFRHSYKNSASLLILPIADIRLDKNWPKRGLHQRRRSSTQSFVPQINFSNLFFFYQVISCSLSSGDELWLKFFKRLAFELMLTHFRMPFSAPENTLKSEDSFKFVEIAIDFRIKN